MACLLTSLSYFLLLVAVSHAATTPQEEYWHSVLPNAPMPKAIRDVLHTDPKKILGNMETEINRYYVLYYEKAVKLGENLTAFNAESGYDPTVTVFFQEKDLKAGAKMKLAFTRSSYDGVTFLPRRHADAVPFSSSRLPEILEHFSVDPKSAMADSMMKTLKECEVETMPGEVKLCATSLESMVDFGMSSLGTDRVEAVSTVVSRDVEEVDKARVFAVSPAPGGIRRLAGSRLVVCHAEAYRYAVFYCHMSAARGYVVELEGEDGARAAAVATCHTNTKAWNADHLAFKVLNVKPGTVPICHFLPQDHVIWSQSRSGAVDSS